MARPASMWSVCPTWQALSGMTTGTRDYRLWNNSIITTACFGNTEIKLNLWSGWKGNCCKYLFCWMSRCTDAQNLVWLTAFWRQRSTMNDMRLQSFGMVSSNNMGQTLENHSFNIYPKQIIRFPGQGPCADNLGPVLQNSSESTNFARVVGHHLNRYECLNV